MRAPAPLAAASARLPPGLRRIMLYGVVGASASIFYSALIVVLVNATALRPTAASALAFFLTIPASFTLHRALPFADRPRDPHQAARFALTNVSSFLLAVGGMYLITEHLGASYWFGIAWNWISVPAMNFLILTLWVFAPGKATQAGQRT